MRILGIR